MKDWQQRTTIVRFQFCKENFDSSKDTLSLFWGRKLSSHELLKKIQKRPMQQSTHIRKGSDSIKVVMTERRNFFSSHVPYRSIEVNKSLFKCKYLGRMKCPAWLTNVLLGNWVIAFHLHHAWENHWRTLYGVREVMMNSYLDLWGLRFGVTSTCASPTKCVMHVLEP